MQINKYIDLSLKNEEAGLEESLGTERGFFSYSSKCNKRPTRQIYCHLLSQSSVI